MSSPSQLAAAWARDGGGLDRELSQMLDPVSSDSDALRKIARRVGEMIRTCPPLGARLQKSWEDYRNLHVQHVEERRECERRQREFAIDILKQGFLWQQPRKEYEPNWDYELFRVRLPSGLVRKWKAEKTPERQKPWNARIARATLRFVKVQDTLLASQSDPEKYRKLWEQVEAQMPLGKFEAITIQVGFRPRKSFEPGPHPLFCSWKQFQRLPVEVKQTVALATLAVLHDDLSPSPVLAPLPSTLGPDPVQGRETVVSWAVRECLRVTESDEGDSSPPQPNPRRLPIDRAKAYFAMLRAEARRLRPATPSRNAPVVPFPNSGANEPTPPRDPETSPREPETPLEQDLVVLDTRPEAPRGLLPCLKVLVFAFSIEARSVAWLLSDVLSRRINAGQQNVRQASSPEPHLSRLRWEAAQRQFGPDSAQQLAGMANPPVPETAMAKYRPMFQWGIDTLDGALEALVDGEGDALDAATVGRETVAMLAADLTAMRRCITQLMSDLVRPVPLDMDPVRKMVGLRERLGSIVDILEFIAKKAMKAAKKGNEVVTTAKVHVEVTAEHRPSSWIAKTTGQGITCEALRKAVKGKRLRQSVKQGEWLHYVPEVARVWPTHAGELQDALVENATFVKPKGTPKTGQSATTNLPGPNRPRPV